MNTNTPCDHNSIMQFEQGDKITTQCTRCGKKIKVVKKPSCSCYGGFDCKICNPDYYEAVKPKLTRESYDENWNMKQTDTPRTDAAAFGSMTDSWELEQLSRQLERELLAARDDNFNLANALSKAEAEVKLYQGVYAAALKHIE